MICLYHLSKVTSRYFCHCTENVVCKLSLLVVHILKRYCTVLTSFAVQLDFFCDDWSVSFTFAFISSNVVSPLVEILSDAIVVTISVMTSILSMSVNAFMLQIDNLNTYDQNFITFEVKKALRSAKKEKPRFFTVSFHPWLSNSHRGLITMVHCPSRRMPRHIRVLFKYIGGKFEQSSKKRERNNRENGYKSPTCAYVFHS